MEGGLSENDQMENKETDLTSAAAVASEEVTSKNHVKEEQDKEEVLLMSC